MNRIKDDDPRLMEDPTVVEIAKKKGKSPAQILIRFALDRGNICIPKSVTPSRIQANFEVRVCLGIIECYLKGVKTRADRNVSCR